MAGGNQDHDAVNTMIERLVADLAPVPPVTSPGRTMATWLGVVFAFFVMLLPFGDFAALIARLQSAPDMWLAIVGAILTSITAAWTAFLFNLPDRTRAWALLPMPPMALWVGASGMGCLREWSLPEFGEIPAHEMIDCFAIIVAVSIPLSVMMLFTLRRGYSLMPRAVLVFAGLSVAAAASVILQLFHPFDATAIDLAVHFLAIMIVVVGMRLFGGRAIGRAQFA